VDGYEGSWILIEHNPHGDRHRMMRTRQDRVHGIVASLEGIEEQQLWRVDVVMYHPEALRDVLW
jgi:hypothetical protein